MIDFTACSVDQTFETRIFQAGRKLQNMDGCVSMTMNDL